MVSEQGMVTAAGMVLGWSWSYGQVLSSPVLAECGVFAWYDSIFYAEHVQPLHLPHYACLFLLRRVKMKKLVFGEALIEVSGTDCHVLCTSDHLASHSPTVLCFCRFMYSSMSLGLTGGLQKLPALNATVSSGDSYIGLNL